MVLDTNVISELMKPSPNDFVLRWFVDQPIRSLYTTVITQSEILHGILLLPSGRRSNSLKKAAEAMFREDFQGRILPFSSDAALPYAHISVKRRQAGRPISQFDAQIAAIAYCSGATVVTRNVSDFEGSEVEILNPWG